MGLYIRKSISVGPFRFNLSKSGVGVSAGIRGFRVGSGPRGNYVHMGRHGVYYRATLPSSTTPESGGRSQAVDPVIPPGTHDPLVEIESADVSQIVDSSSAELLKELDEKRRKMRLWPITAIAFAGMTILGVNAGWSAWIMWLVVAAGAISVYLTYQRDLLAKTVVLFYNLEPEAEELYARLLEAAGQLAGCSRAWHIEAQGAVRDRKYHAGASSLVRRKATSIRKTEPPYVKTNVETVAIGVGRQTLHFFPDRVLVYESHRVGAVGYGTLEIDVEPSRFIEEGGVPADARVVDRTWRYVNKKGGPDRRFKDNRELPICLYDEISLSSSTGLREVVQVSRAGCAMAFAEAIEILAERLPREVGPEAKMGS